MIRRRMAGVETPPAGVHQVLLRNGRQQLQRSTSIRHRLTSRRAFLSYALSARPKKKPQYQPLLTDMQTIIKQKKHPPSTMPITRLRKKNLPPSMITTLVRQRNLR